MTNDQPIKINVDKNKVLREFESMYSRPTKDDYGHRSINKMNSIIAVLANIREIAEKYKAIDLDTSKKFKGFEYGAICQMLVGINMYSNNFTRAMGDLSVLMKNADAKIQEAIASDSRENVTYRTIISKAELLAIVDPVKDKCETILKGVAMQSDFVQASHYFRNTLNELLPNIPLGSRHCLMPSETGFKVVPVQEYNSHEAFHVYSGFSLYTRIGPCVADMFQIPISAVVNNMHILAERNDNGVAMPFVIKQDIACLITAIWHFIFSVFSLLEILDSSRLSVFVVPRLTLNQFKAKYPKLTDNYCKIVDPLVQDIPEENINLKNVVVELMSSIYKSSYVNYVEMCQQSSSKDAMLDNLKNVSASAGIMDRLAPLRSTPVVGKVIDTAILHEEKIKNLISGGITMDSINAVAEIWNSANVQPAIKN